MKKKCWAIAAIAVILIIFSFIGCAYLQLFVYGGVASCESIIVKETNLVDSELQIVLDLYDSALEYKRYIAEIEGDTMYIKVYKGLIEGEPRDMDNVVVSVEDVQKVVITDGEKDLEVWEKKE